MTHILSNSRSSRPIRNPLKSINHASKYCVYERYHYFGAHFTEIQRFAMKKMLKMSQLDGLPQKYVQNVVTQVKLFIMTMKSLLEVKDTWMLLNIILSDLQQYRTLPRKVFQFYVSPEKCENQRYKVLTPNQRYGPFHDKGILITYRSNYNSNVHVELSSEAQSFIFASTFIVRLNLPSMVTNVISTKSSCACS